MPEIVTLDGKTFHLETERVKEGEQAPDCELIGPDLKPVRLSSFKGKAILLMTLPSLDTGVCNKEAHRFNQEVSQLGEGLVTLCVSMDLPFAQSRWCGAEGVKNIITLSDYKTHECGKKYGVLISELGLLTRAVFLIDPSMKVVLSHLVKEVTHEPDYPLVMKSVTNLLTKVG